MTTTPHGQVPEALQLADEISKAGAFPAYPRAPYEAAAAELRRLHAQVAALTAAPQGVAYAELPEPDATTVGLGAVWNRHSMRDFADRAHALRAPHGQAPSQAGEYPALVCDYCWALTPDPWHSSGMLHGKMSKHIHSCDACAARGAAEAQATPQADSQPAPEYVGSGMFKGETIEKAAEHWANWCDVRCMTGLSEFLRVVAAHAPTDSQPAPVLDYPPLPTTYYLAGGAVRTWDEGQMRAYVDADRAARATADSVLEDAADPLQGAANWLVKAHSWLETSTLAGKLSIGYNRAKRLHDAAIAARKQGGA